MIRTLIRVAWTSLRRDRAAQLLTFGVPIAFFSIFAVIFSGQSGARTPRVDVLAVDEDRSDASRRLMRGLARESSLVVHAGPAARPGTPSRLYTRAEAESLVRAGEAPVAAVIPPGWGARFPDFRGAGPAVDLYADVSNPVAPQIVNGLLQKVAMTSTPDLFARGGFVDFDTLVGGLTPRQRAVAEGWFVRLRSWSSDSTAGGVPAADSSSRRAGVGGLVRTRTVDLLGERKRNPIVAFFAASIGVMWLLFSCSGAAGSLLDEADQGTLDRLLDTGIGMTRVLLGKWAYLVQLGVAQLSAMFLWGALVFKVELFTHLPGFIVMAVASSAAAGGVGLVLATACRSRHQQGGISTLVILTMSALGGSMLPRFLMGESLQRFGLLTFNAWAIDGFTKVFWREEPLAHLWPQVLVLATMTLVFLSVARVLARRWERA